MMTVWPALWPPAYLATTAKRSESTSTILPLPSSPHWAPSTTAVFARIRTFLDLPAARAVSTLNCCGRLSVGERGRELVQAAGCGAESFAQGETLRQGR